MQMKSDSDQLDVALSDEEMEKLVKGENNYYLIDLPLQLLKMGF